MDKEKEIGEVFRESLEGYQAETPAGLWEAISQDKTLLRFNRRRRMLRIAKFAALPAIATVAIVTAILLFNGKSDTTLAVTTDQAPISQSTSPTLTPNITPNSPTTSTAPAPTREQKVTASEKPSFAEDPIADEVPAMATVEPTEPAMADEVIKSISSKQTTTSTTKEEPQVAVKSTTSPATDPLQPKSGRSGQLTYSKDTSVCRNSQLTLYVHNAMDVHWNIGLQGESITLFPEEPMLIAATITTFEKIDTTIYIQIGVFDCGLWIPTAFTPNGDGLNDEFIVHAPAGITHYECAIYDRSRGLLFRTNNILQGWDGTANGKPLPLGAYFYIITYRDEAGVKHVEKGQITLIR